MSLFPKIDYADTDNVLLVQQNTLRKLVGVLGVLLPLLLYVFLFIDTHYGKPLESISHYYFTRVCGIFVITVSLLAVFLIVYKGKEKIDFYLSTIAGVFALVLILFPTNNISKNEESAQYVVTILRESRFRFWLHYAAAGIFFLCLAAMSLFLFTKSNKPKELRTKQKNIRNVIYIICGIAMLVAIVTIFAGLVGIIDSPFYFSNHLTFWMETLAVESFGFAWLVKAEVFFKDKFFIKNFYKEKEKIQ